jgi:predicted alpha/beta-hydrolase family hydrolase
MSSDPQFLVDGPVEADTTMVLAHGAGAGMDTPFMTFFAIGLANHGVRIVRFEFQYMATKRATGKSKPPDREPILREAWLKAIEKFGHEGLVIGGKSMGGRIASLIADEAGVAGLVCLGYPFHPVGKPDKLRVKHLQTIKTPTLILQGERDPFGGREEVAKYKLSPAVQVEWIMDGDHSYKPRKASGTTDQENWQAALDAIGSFLESLR